MVSMEAHGLSTNSDIQRPHTMHTVIRITTASKIYRILAGPETFTESPLIMHFLKVASRLYIVMYHLYTTAPVFDGLGTCGGLV